MSRSQPLLGAIAGSALAAFLLVACGSSDASEGADSGVGAVSAAPREVDAGRPDAGPPPPSGPPKRIFTKRFVVNVRARPDRESPRIGYLRAGSVLQATTHEPVSTEGCREGWYELTTGGFVCNGRDVIAFEGRRLPERRAVQPDREAAMPYAYARTRRDNTPMYRRLPTDLEAAVHEGYRPPGKRLAHLPDGGVMFVDATPDPEPGSDPAPASGTDAPPEASAQVAAAREAESAGSGSAVGAEEDTEEPGVVTLDQLQGERGSVLQRRLVKGFVVSLDREMRVRSRRYWRTQSNGFVPYASQVEVTGSSFRGVHLSPPLESEPAAEAGADDTAGADASTGATAEAEGELRWELPIGYVLSSKVASYTRGRDGRPRRSRAPGYHHVFRIVDREMHRDREYLVGHDDRLYLASEIRVIEAHDPPPEIGPDERWLEVDLTNQALVAYEGRRPVFATLVSTGRVRTPNDPLRDWRTPTGLFRLTSKHVTNNMDGDHAIDGPYSLEDVPYVMYFHLAYAIHSAFWHNVFGRTRSHGCVNLSPEDARWVFDWAGPPVPEGWHGAFPTEEQPGTWIWIHGEKPQG